MIWIGFDLVWPVKKDTKQVDYFCKTWPVTKNKSFEVQLSRAGGNHFKILGLEFSWWLYQCHAGPKLELGFMSFWLILFFYDNRHWDYDKGEWEVYEKEDVA
jgi:hypothetical protein